MSSNISRVPVSLVTALSTALNSLASGSAVQSSAITVAAALWMDIILTGTFASTVTADAMVDVYVVRQDGSGNYEDTAVGGYGRDALVGTFFLQALTTAQRLRIRDIPAPARDFEIYVVNNSGKAMAASGNTIQIDFHTEQAS
jgi:hypothetical protein